MFQIFRRSLWTQISIRSLIASARSNKKLFRCSKSPTEAQFSTESPKGVYLIDDTDSDGSKSPKSINRYTTRTHTCGELRVENVGDKVVLCGWLEYQRMNKFVVLRDSYGETQLLITDGTKNPPSLEIIPYESIIEVSGTVVARPKDMVNKKQQTGEIEVKVDSFHVINKAKHILPFNIREFQKAKEALRMQYRYMDIRFPQMQRNLRIRSKLLMKIREFLIDNHFVDVETPTLFKATPGGAQEFVVPTRFPGKFYSLVQSPQQFKQMLMAGALDRYFQIAKCFRDESARSDRQPEFTQLDIELSFTNVDAIIQLIEELLFYALGDFCGGIPRTFLRMSYKEALESYGTDKPDISFDYKLQNCTSILEKNKTIATVGDFGAYLLVFDPQNMPCTLTKSVKEIMLKTAKQYAKARLVQSVVTKDWPIKMQNLFSTEEAQDILKTFSIHDGSVLFICYGTKNEANSLLGKIRTEYVHFLEQSAHVNIRKKGLHFLWVVDFPLFETNEQSGKMQSAHHPFTGPHPDDMELLNQNPLKVRALAYDLVLNGYEIGGGSIRIHDPVLQEQVLDLLDIDRHSLQHIIDMLGSGCPPHGGIALGLDRLLTVLLNMTSIRDVIAFPKTFEGKEPISQAPSELPSDTLNLYHIRPITGNS